MDGSHDESPDYPVDRVARTTLALGVFMMLLLISLPFTFETDSSGYFASYLIYSMF